MTPAEVLEAAMPLGDFAVEHAAVMTDGSRRVSAYLAGLDVSLSPGGWVLTLTWMNSLADPVR